MTRFSKLISAFMNSFIHFHMPVFIHLFIIKLFIFIFKLMIYL